MMSAKSPFHGFILLDKPCGITSFDTLQPVKRALATGKVGHTGTLDKFASGLLIALAGRALKLSAIFMHCDKRYEGLIRFGEETDTLDPEGAVIKQCALPTEEAVRAALPQWTGAIMQTPPVFSALHIDGKRASDIARSGVMPRLKARPVRVHSLELLSWEPPFAKIAVHCSSGTYVRSLARDIASTAGSCGRLQELRRTCVGGFSVEGALAIPADKYAQLAPPAVEAAVRPCDKDAFAKIGVQCADVNEEAALAMRHGKALPLIEGLPPRDSLQEGFCAVFSEAGELAAVLEKTENRVRYFFVNNNVET